MSTYFKQIPENTIKISTSAAITRFINSLGFRYYWATENLTTKEFHFTPGNGSMTINELNLHIYDLVIMIYKTFNLKSDLKKIACTDFETTRIEILRLLEHISQQLPTLSDTDLKKCRYYAKKYNQEYPFWQMLNGPIADALTHVGQITSWRRLSGNPQPKGVNVFLGKQIYNQKNTTLCSKMLFF